MFRNIVHFSAPADYRIFQQSAGFADIDVEGYLAPEEAPEQAAAGYFVMLALVREDDGSYVCLWERAEQRGNTFRHTFRHVPAGGLYTVLSVYTNGIRCYDDGLRGDSIHHLGVGDLYVIAGQSNAAGFARTPAYDPVETGLHLFRTSGKWDLASSPLNDATDSTRPVTTEFGIPGQSPFMSFARTLKRSLHYPIGLIQTALGGSPLCAWSKEKDGQLYHNLVRTVAACGGKVKGIVWYQGCTDGFHIETAEAYYEGFAAMVSDLRADLKDPALPFLTVQLNRIVQPRMEECDRGWATVREAQRRAAMLPYVYLAPSSDLTMSDGIHNSASANVVLGQRLAALALRHFEGLHYLADAPTVETAVLKDRTLTLCFRDVSLYLVSLNLPVERHPFVIEDEAGVLPLLGYRAEEDRLILQTGRDAVGAVTVSAAPFAFPDPFMPIDRGTGLPILLFDRFPVETRIEG